MRKEEKYIRNGMCMTIHCGKYRRPKNPEDHPPAIHYHDYCELVFGISGICHCNIGTEKYSIGKGDMIFINSHEPHATGYYNDVAEYIVLKFLPSVLSAGTQTLSEYSYLLHLYTDSNLQRIFFSSEEIRDLPFSFLFNKILNEWNEHFYGYEIALRAHVLEIFLNIIRIWNKETPDTQRKKLSSEQEVILQKSIEYIEENLTTVSQANLANAMNVSASHLSRIFKNGLNTSFSKFVNSIKLRESEKLLLTTSMSITEIGEACGFSTTSYFISNFNSKHKITPAKYRLNSISLKSL